MRDATLRVAREECRRENPEACLLVEPEWPAEDRLAALDWDCQVRRSACDRLGEEMLALGRLDSTRLDSTECAPAP